MPHAHANDRDRVRVALVGTRRAALMFALLSFLLSSCADSDAKGGFVVAVKPAGRVTLSLAAIRGRTFLYGSDLQYSGINDGVTQAADSTYALGHLIVTFEDGGDRLRLVQDQSSLFESDVNRPERLLHQFTVVERDARTVTILIEAASPALATSVSDSPAPPLRTSWIRSVQYAAEQDVLMFESSIEAADGTVYEFMESLFPRENLVPDGVAPLFADPGVEPFAARFNFIGGGPVWLGGEGESSERFQTAVAARFLVKPGQLIEWYVTGNIPEDFVPDVQQGVEAWNRYAQARWKRDIVAFRGRLPASVKIGDPRYNVINWDSVQDSPAAYESQAYDPLTGIQSHALIYLPLAWFNIGVATWSGEGLSDAQGRASRETFLDKHRFFGRKLKPACVRDLKRDQAFSLDEDPFTFGHELVRATLFHEVGHALGMGHNFKASTSYDLETAESYTTSIMDYNQYALDRAAFDSPSKATGPLLEYDRQIFAVLYGGEKGRAEIAKAAVLPMCRDEQVASPDAVGAVDPACQQYDAGGDPSSLLARNIALLSDEAATVGTTESLPRTLRRASSQLPSSDDVLTKDDAIAAVQDHVSYVQDLMSYFVDSRVASPASQSQTFLSVFEEGSLPDGIDEAEVRARTLASLQTIAGFETLPEAADAALQDDLASVTDWLLKTPYFKKLSASKRPAALEAVLEPLATTGTWYATTLLPDERGLVLGALRYSPTLPYAFSASPAVDYESEVIALLEAGMTSSVADAPRPVGERLAVAVALATFAEVAAGQAAVQRVAEQVQLELTDAPSTGERDGLRSILNALRGQASGVSE